MAVKETEILEFLQEKSMSLNKELNKKQKVSGMRKVIHVIFMIVYFTFAGDLICFFL
jgi:hypothetical protein